MPSSLTYAAADDRTRCPATNRRRRPPARHPRSLLAVVVAVVALALGAGCAGGAGDAGGVDAPDVSTTAGVGAEASAPSAPPVEDRAAVATRAVARPTSTVTALDAPVVGAPLVALPPATDLGSARALLVVDEVDGWLEVLLPVRPNGTTGWISAEDVEVRHVPLAVEVDLSARTLTVTDGDQVVLTSPVAVGAPETPTPTGEFSITDKLATPEPGSPYGPFALGLSGHSDVVTEFAGGDGQIGIHGTDDPASIGAAVSHGCIRVPNDVVTSLSDLLPLGTPVTVR